jgi:hypothetical protein
MTEILQGQAHPEVQYESLVCTQEHEVENMLSTQPDVAVYNFYPNAVLPFLTAMDLKNRWPATKHLYMLHEFGANPMLTGGFPHDNLFSAVVVTDPSSVGHTDDCTWFATVRPLPSKGENMPLVDALSKSLSVGCFGFAFDNKSFPWTIQRCYEAWAGKTDVTLRFHLTNATFTGPYTAEQAHADNQSTVDRLNTKYDVDWSYVGTSHFISNEELVTWLAENTLNVLGFQRNSGRGISSTIDYLVASGAPMALINYSDQFRHVLPFEVCDELPQTTEDWKVLRTRTHRLADEWSHEVFCRQWADIVRKVTA